MMVKNLIPWIEAQFKKGEAISDLSEYDRLNDLEDIFKHLILSPECNWEKARTFLEQLLKFEIIEKHWEQLDYEAKNWEPGQGIFLSELLTDFGALPTAAALGAISTTLRLLPDNELRNKAELASQNWWTRLTRSLWGHGFDTYGQRVELIKNLDMGGVLQSKQDDPWVHNLQSYFKEVISERRASPTGWGIGDLSDSLEALLRLGPISSEYQDKMFALLEPQEQENAMETPLVKIFRTYSLDDHDLEKHTSPYLIQVLPPHRFRAKLSGLPDSIQDVESIYYLKTLLLREALLDLMQDSPRSFSLNELIQQSTMDPLETQIIVGHLLKSGLVEVDVDTGERPRAVWHDPDQKFHLSHQGTELLAATSD